MNDLIDWKRVKALLPVESKVGNPFEEYVMTPAKSCIITPMNDCLFNQGIASSTELATKQTVQQNDEEVIIFNNIEFHQPLTVDKIRNKSVV